MANRKIPLSLKISPELNLELEEAAKRLGVTKHKIAHDSLVAVLQAIVENDYRIVLPIRMKPTHVVSESSDDPRSKPKKTKAA